MIEPRLRTTDATRFAGVSLSALRKRAQVEGLELPRVGPRSRYLNHIISRKVLRLPWRRLTASWQIVKGGVGKTSLCHIFGTRACSLGARVLFIDLDQQANLTESLGVSADKPGIFALVSDSHPQEKASDVIIPVSDGLDLIPSSVHTALLDNLLLLGQHALDRVLRSIIAPVKDHYDLVFIDCPPALTPSVATATLASDLVICPVAPESFSLTGLQLTVNHVEQLSQRFGAKQEIKILLNKFNARAKLSSSIVSQIMSNPAFSSHYVPGFIRETTSIPSTIAAGTGLFEDRRVKAVHEDIDSLIEAVCLEGSADAEPVDLGTLAERVLA
jgi:chromosome partitioning protein